MRKGRTLWDAPWLKCCKGKVHVSCMTTASSIIIYDYVNKVLPCLVCAFIGYAYCALREPNFWMHATEDRGGYVFLSGGGVRTPFLDDVLLLLHAMKCCFIMVADCNVAAFHKINVEFWVFLVSPLQELEHDQCHCAQGEEGPQIMAFEIGRTPERLNAVNLLLRHYVRIESRDVPSAVVQSLLRSWRPWTHGSMNWAERLFDVLQMMMFCSSEFLKLCRSEILQIWFFPMWCLQLSSKCHVQWHLTHLTLPTAAWAGPKSKQRHPTAGAGEKVLIWWFLVFQFQSSSSLALRSLKQHWNNTDQPTMRG